MANLTDCSFRYIIKNSLGTVVADIENESFSRAYESIGVIYAFIPLNMEIGNYDSQLSITMRSTMYRSHIIRLIYKN
jgi:hypothetical protein